MKFKRAVLIAAAAGIFALTGCAARSEYYGVFVEENADCETSELLYFSDCKAWSDYEGSDTYFPEITEETTETPETASTPSPSVTSAPVTTTPKPPETSATTPESSATAPLTTPKPQTTTTPKTAAPSTPSTASTTPATPSTPSEPAPQTTPSTPATTSVSSAPATTPKTHAPSTNPVNPATTPETTERTKVTTTATVAAAMDEPAPAEEYITEVLRLVNVERTNAGLSPLVLDSELSEAAKERAEEQIELFGHTRPDGQSCFTVFKEHGIDYSTAGENAAAGYSTPEEVVEAWMSSDGHRANILKPCFEKLGVGFAHSDDSYGTYWVQLFIEE